MHNKQYSVAVQRVPDHKVLELGVVIAIGNFASSSHLLMKPHLNVVGFNVLVILNRHANYGK
jgi:hypothetical protein